MKQTLQTKYFVTILQYNLYYIRNFRHVDTFLNIFFYFDYGSSRSVAVAQDPQKMDADQQTRRMGSILIRFEITTLFPTLYL
jgi:hypothetical protein